MGFQVFIKRIHPDNEDCDSKQGKKSTIHNRDLVVRVDGRRSLEWVGCLRRGPHGLFRRMLMGRNCLFLLA